MAARDTTSPYLTYPAVRPSGRRWRRYAAIASLVAAIPLPFVTLHGKRLIGFVYSLPIDTSLTLCPDQVTAQLGDTIALADGRSFMLDADALPLADDLARAENHVFIDVRQAVVFGRFRYQYCALVHPELSQIITIPLCPRELPSHGREIIARLRRPKPVPTRG